MTLTECAKDIVDRNPKCAPLDKVALLTLCEIGDGMMTDYRAGDASKVWRFPAILTEIMATAARITPDTGTSGFFDNVELDLHL